MEIRFAFKRNCYLAETRRALLFAAVFALVGSLVCFCSGGIHIYSMLLLPRFALGKGISILLWTVVHILAGISLEILISSCARRCNKKIRAVTLVCLAVITGYICIPLFFAMNAFFIAFIVFILVASITLSAIKILIRLCPLSAFLLLPYFIWSFYCAVLTFCVMLLNL